MKNIVSLLLLSLLAEVTTYGGWQKMNSGTTVNLLGITVHHSSSTGSVWACGEHGVILYSSNGGNNWSPQNSGTNATLHCLTFKEMTGGVFATGENGVILRTSDLGTTWTQVPSGTNATLRYHSDFGWIIVGDSGIVLRSSDNGLSWVRKHSGTTVRLDAVAGAFSMYAVGNNGTVIKGFNGGESWQVVNTGMQEHLLGVPMFGSVDYVVGSGGLILKSSNFGTSWQTLPSRTNATLRSVEFSVNNTSRMYAVGDNGTIVKTTDAGVTWGRQESPTTSNLRSVFFYLNDNVGFACGDSGTILRTTDGGGNFVAVPDSLEDMLPMAVGNQWEYNDSWFDNDYYSGVNTSFLGTARLTVVGAVHSQDSTLWHFEEHVEGTYCVRYWPNITDSCYPSSSINTFDLIERHGWRHRLIRYSSYYNFWNSILPFGNDLTEPALLYRYAYPDSLRTTHIRVHDSHPFQSVQYNFLFKADSGLLAVICRSQINGRSFGSHHRLINGILTHAEERQHSDPPPWIFLNQNYPNPFNISTSIIYGTLSTEPVRLRVVDVLGREVATLVDGILPAGVYKVTFAPETLSSGVYVYELQTGGLREARKMLLMK